MIQPKLTQEQEREVALAYLCGVRSKNFQELFGVSHSTVSNNIVGKRSKEWDDKLVEFYREAYPGNRDKNFAHMFLTFNTNRDYKVLPSGLMVPDKNLRVGKVVEDAIYKPGIEKVSDRIALREYFDGQTPYDKLINIIFGLSPKERTEDIPRKTFVNLLKRDYSPDGNISLKDVFGETGEIIIDKIKNGGLAWTPSKKGLVHEVLNTLIERERVVLGMTFGLDGYEGPKTNEEIGKDFFSVSKERIRQLQAKALRKLKHPSRSGKLRSFIGLATDEDVAEYVDQISHQEERKRLREELYPVIEAEVRKKIAYEGGDYGDGLFNTCIEDTFDLSVRTANCLRNDNIITVGDLVQKTEQEMLRTPNFGRKSLNELKQNVLGSHGLHFGMDIKSFLQTQEREGSE